MKVTKFHLLYNKDYRLTKLLIDLEWYKPVYYLESDVGTVFWVLLHNMLDF